MYKLQSLKIKNIISFKEQEYTFKNGKALLVVGQNLTDVGQKSNGSGKSAFMESISIAFNGTSVRDVKTKELINRNSDSAEVELTLFNTRNNSYFKIWRKIYSNSKSAEYRAWINDKEQLDRYSDANMFNSFVWETIGITKEDFFSFYFLTGDYVPFLNTSDTAKKSIINRFSGADKVDKAFPLIEEDCEAVQAKILTEEKNLVANRAKQEVIAEQILNEETRISDEAKNAVILEKEKEIAYEKENTSVYEESLTELNEYCSNAQVNLQKYDSETILKPFKEAIAEAQNEYDTFTFTKDFEGLFSMFDSEKEAIEKKVAEKKQLLPKVKEKYQSEIDAITTEENELKQSLAEAENDLEGYELFESEVQKQLMDAITCPKCSHKFSLRNKTFDFATVKKSAIDVQSTIQDYKELVKEIKGQINVEIQEKKSAVNEKILADGSVIKSDLERYNKALIEIGNKELTLNKEWQDEENKRQIIANKINTCKRELKSKEQECNHQLQMLKSAAENCVTNVKRKQAELKNHLQHIQLLEKQLEQFRNQEQDKTKLTTLEKQLAELITTESKITDKLEILRKERENIDKWELAFKSFKSFLANKSLLNIEQYSNIFLQQMNSNLSIRLEGYKTLANKKLKEQITVTVLRNGFEEGGFGSFSGGEQSRINLATALGMSELINLSSPTGGLDFLLIDECLDQVDLLGIESIINSLQSVGKTVLIITQHTEVNSLNGNTLTIQKKNNISTILN